ncbi:hypothetical protein BHM03_00057658, partial [Ensete ventricosum]
VRVISSPGSGGASRGDPKVGSSGASSGPPSLVDARVLRDLEVMKADHDLDTAVTEGSLVVIRGRYNISVEFGLHVSQPGQRPYSSDDPGMCISVDALEASLRFPRHPLIEECLSAEEPGLSRPETYLWHVFASVRVGVGYYLTAQVGFRVSGVPSHNKGWQSRYIFVSGPVWGFRLDCSAHSIGNTSPYLSKEEFVLVGILKGILSSSCAIKEMTELWLVDAGLSPASRGTVILPCFSFSSCFLTFKLGCRSDGSRRVARDAQGVWRQGLLNSHRCSGGRRFSREGSLEGLNSHRLSRPAIRLGDTRSNLAKVQRLLKEARVRARKMDDELQQAMKALENARTELPRQVVVQYKESIGFKEGLKRMGRVTYEYGYRVALARFHARHPDSEVEKDPFTIRPEDDLVPMERQ